MKKLEDYVINIPDFPEEGIMFRDVTGILGDADGLAMAVDELCDITKDLDVDVVVGPEARGFIFGVPVAYKKKLAFVPIRKKGKLPRETISVSYELEYGQAEIEIHTDAIKKGQKVLIVDDLLATGGTLKAITSLVEKLGGEVVGISVVMELKGLNGRDLLKDYRIDSCIEYEGK